MFEVRNLQFSYGSRAVLNGVSFQAAENELLFVLGANGAGKTTLFRCMLGLLHGYRGDILLDGKNITALSAKELARKIAYIPQFHNPVFPYTALDMVMMGTNHRLSTFASPGRKEREISMQAMAQLGIEEFAERNFQELSGGEQQLVLVARALAQQAKILLMDEPTSALDFGNQIRVLGQISALSTQGYTILLSCHNPQHALLYARRVLALNGGTVAADGPPSESLNPELIRLLYGVSAHFVRTGDGILIAPAQDSLFQPPPRPER